MYEAPLQKLSDYTNANKLLFQFNSDFNCPGCQLITTEESLRGTISQGQTTITTYIPPIATSPTSDQDTTVPSIDEPTPDFSQPGITETPPLTTVAPPSLPVESTPIVDSHFSTISITSGNLISTVTPEPYISTIEVEDVITKTYVITTSTALVLLVTETSTYTEIETITQNHPYVDHRIFTTSVPISTYTTVSNHERGYFNVTDFDEYYKEFVTTKYSTFETTYNLVRERYEITYSTRILEKIITSTLIVWNNQLTESYIAENGYYTTVTTITPGPYVTTIVPSIITASAPEITHTITVTITPVPLESSTVPATADICATMFTANDNSNGNENVYIPQVFNGHAKKTNVPFFYYLGVIIPFLF